MKFYKVRDVCKLVSVTVRTLHYYDEIGLLKPSYVTITNHRLYTEYEITQLKQIVTLQQMGLTLEQVKAILLNKTDIKSSFSKQADLLASQAKKLSYIANLITNLTNQLDLSNPIDWKTVPQVMNVIQRDKANTKTWYQNYLTLEELDEDAKIANSYSKEFWEDYTERWQNMFKEVEMNLHTDPEGDAGMELARKWMALVEEIYPNPTPLRNKLWEAYKAGITPEDRMPHNREVIVYITKATKKYKLLRGY